MRPVFLLFLLSGCSKLFVSDQDVLPLYDQDGDGYYAEQATAVGETGPFDCDDGDGDVHPGGTDVCNGLDDDCDGTPDDGDDRVTFYEDADGDGYGDEPRLACSAPAGFVAVSGDCDDGNDTIHPGATDLCNGADEDCDGTADDGPDRLTWYLDRDGDGYGSDERLSCTQPTGFIAKGGDCDDDDADTHPGGTEVCGGGDEDCDGKVDAADDSLADGTEYYADADGDGTGDAKANEVACSQPTGFVDDATDCDDGDSAVHVGAKEVCDGLDDDCDGQTDDADSGVTGRTTWYRDADKDGYGDAATSTVACDQPSGYVADSTDCHDTDGKSYPGASEWCGAYDYDCDGLTEEASSVDAITVYDDADGDGYGDPATHAIGCLYGTLVTDATDCDDGSAEHHPGATEYCLDDYDDDCDGSAGPCEYEVGASLDDSKAPSFTATFGPPYGDSNQMLAFGDYGATGTVLITGLVTSMGTGYVLEETPSSYLTTGTSTPLTTSFSWLTGSTPYPTAPLRTLTAATLVTAQRIDEELIIAAPFAGDVDGDGVVYITSGGSDLASCTYQFTASGYPGIAVDAWETTPGYRDSFVVSSGTNVVYLVYGYGSYRAPQSLSDFGKISGSGTFGQSLVARSDLDGNGTGEIVVGAPSKTSASSVYVFQYVPSFGSSTTSDAETVLTASATSTQFGTRIWSNGDIDGDGYSDLLVGAPSDDSSGYRDAGAVYVFTGPLSSGTEKSATMTLLGSAIDQGLGADVLAHDMDDDGVDDVLAGASEGTMGAVYGFLAPAAGSTSSAAYDYRFAGAVQNAYHLVPAEDVDGDGAEDFCIWGHTAAYVFTLAEL